MNFILYLFVLFLSSLVFLSSRNVFLHRKSAIETQEPIFVNSYLKIFFVHFSIIKTMLSEAFGELFYGRWFISTFHASLMCAKLSHLASTQET